jgi:hypothetical protein
MKSDFVQDGPISRWEDEKNPRRGGKMARQKQNEIRLTRFGSIIGLMFENGGAAEMLMTFPEIHRLLEAWQEQELVKKQPDQKIVSALDVLCRKVFKSVRALSLKCRLPSGAQKLRRFLPNPTAIVPMQERNPLENRVQRRLEISNPINNPEQGRGPTVSKTIKPSVKINEMTFEDWLNEVRTALKSINMPLDEWQRTWEFDFHQQAQKQDWAAAWGRVNAPVLVLYGEYDWYEDAAAHALIANRKQQGRGEIQSDSPDRSPFHALF